MFWEFQHAILALTRWPRGPITAYWIPPKPLSANSVDTDFPETLCFVFWRPTLVVFANSSSESVKMFSTNWIICLLNIFCKRGIFAVYLKRNWRMSEGRLFWWALFIGHGRSMAICISNFWTFYFIITAPPSPSGNQFHLDKTWLRFLLVWGIVCPI